MITKTIISLGCDIDYLDVNGVKYFCGMQLFDCIGLTWKGGSDIKKRVGDSCSFITHRRNTKGGMQDSLFVDVYSCCQIVQSTRRLVDTRKTKLINDLTFGLYQSHVSSPKESTFSQTVKSICDAFYMSCFFQFPIMHYKADIFIPTVGFIEFQELHHKSKVIEDSKRAKEIECHTGLPVIFAIEGHEFEFYTDLIKIFNKRHSDRQKLIPEYEMFSIN